LWRIYMYVQWRSLLSRGAVCLMAAHLLCQIGFAQQAQEKPKTKGSKQSQSESGPLASQRERTLIRVRGLADRIFTFRDVKTKAFSLADFADVIWKADEVCARGLYLKAYESLKPSSSTVEKPSNQSLSAESLAYLREELIARLSRQDINLARRLTEGEVASDMSHRIDRAETYLASAMYIVDDQPGRARELAEQSLKESVSQSMIELLWRLRSNDEKAANDLFLKTLSRLTASPNVDVNELLMLGAYVFTSPMEDLPANATQMISVGKQMVVNLSADRPGVPPQIVRAYLDAAVSILSRPISNPKQKQLSYIAAYQLFPRVRQFLPARAPALAAAMQALVPDIPPELSQESSYSKLALTSTVKDLAQELHDIENITGLDRREAEYLSLTFTLWWKGDFKNSRTVAARIKDATARGQLLTFIDFAEAASSLKHGETSFAEEKATKLASGIERALLWLGLAQARFKQGDNARTSEAINESLKDARRIEDIRRAFLVLTAASELARFDPLIAGSTLSEAVQAFNSIEATSSDNIRWVRTVEAGTLWRDFPVEIEGIQFNFAQALLPLIAADPEGTLSIIANVKNEELLGKGLAVLAEALLKK
jgi:hypothetical protein